MEIILIFLAMVFLLFGSILLLSPETFLKIAQLSNQVVFTIDEKVPSWRRPIGIIFLILTIFLWFIAFQK